MKKPFLCGACCLLAAAAHAEPAWIWTTKPARGDDRITARKSFVVEGDVESASLWLTCDNGATAKINGRKALVNRDWQEPVQANVAMHVTKGRNEIVVEAKNQGGSAGLIAVLTVKLKSGPELKIETGAEWEAAATGGTEWKPAVVVGKLGAPPWGDVMSGRPKKEGKAVESGDLHVAEGFRCDLLYTVPKEEQGSWVSMTVDPQGRLIAGDQYGALYRVTLPPVASTNTPAIEKIDTVVGGAHGLLYAFQSLYVMVNEQPNSGVWRLKDIDGAGRFAAAEHIVKIAGHGEHGPHGIWPGPDGRSIFFACGNHTKYPEGMERMRMADAWGEDNLLPRMWDPSGHARGVLAPGGYACKADPDGRHVELYVGGFRNQYDMAFDPNGELFTYDSDMEWDMGMPWYRPTRIYHCPSGTDLGWRSGSPILPMYYVDTLPAAWDIGPGSPTGVAFGYGAKFPAKYQRAFFAADWTYGTLYAMHLTPDGASFRAAPEEFIFGKALSLTDLVVNPRDGAMYFVIGGRRNQSALYRVRYVGNESTAPVPPLPMTAAAKLRHELEALQDAGVGPEAIAKAWPHLGHADRWVRYAARVAIEKQPHALWQEKAFAEQRPDAAILAVVALARVATNEAPALQSRLLARLNSLSFAAMPVERQLDLARAYQLCFLRLGKPAPDVCARQAQLLDALYPHADARMNAELSQLLIYLDSPTAVAKTMHLAAIARETAGQLATDAMIQRNTGYGSAAARVQKSRPNQPQIHLMFALRNAKTGWTPELLDTYFQWFHKARAWTGGNTFGPFTELVRDIALTNIAPGHLRAHLDEISKKGAGPATPFVMPKGPGRAYTVTDIVALAKDGLKGRDFNNGRTMFNSALCSQCHHFAGEGGNVGPDLTGVGSRYSLRDLAENIVEPSKVISDQYPSHEIVKKDGSLAYGRIIGEENGQLLVIQNVMNPNQVSQIPLADVQSRKVSTTSLMPPSLINTLNADELLDLLAYLMSGGNPDDKAFAK